MGTKKDRSRDWLAQAEHALGQAEWLLLGDYYDGACFHSQQAAEFALKALHYSLDLEGWGHALKHLVNDLSDHLRIPRGIEQAAMRLDGFYILTRYTNGFDLGSPKDNNTSRDARVAIGHARTIIEFCEKNLRR
jgi:HEPN domain-containing protein